MSVKNNDLTGVKQVKNEGERVINCDLGRAVIGSKNGSQPGVKSGVKLQWRADAELSPHTCRVSRILSGRLGRIADLI